jgi:hypothetical protein
MSKIDQNSLGLANIGRDHWDVPIRVELRAYLDFTRRMNIQLRHLTERWAKKTKSDRKYAYRNKANH